MSGIIILLAAVLAGVLLFIRSQPPARRGIAPIINVAAMEPDSSQWGVNFPNEYSSFLKTQTNNTRTTYG